MRCATTGAKPLRSLLFQARRQIEESALMSKGYSETYEWSWDCRPLIWTDASVPSSRHPQNIINKLMVGRILSAKADVVKEVL